MFKLTSPSLTNKPGKACKRKATDIPQITRTTKYEESGNITQQSNLCTYISTYLHIYKINKTRLWTRKGMGGFMGHEGVEDLVFPWTHIHT